MPALPKTFVSLLIGASLLSCACAGSDAPPTVKPAPTVVSAEPLPLEAQPSASFAHSDRPFVEPPAPVVSATSVSAEARSHCDHQCGDESRRCSNGCEKGEEGRGCLRRCGCAKVTCEDSCERDGTADFRCH